VRVSYPVHYVAVAPRPASGAATASLVLGLAGFFGFFLVLPSIAAIVAGHMATRETSTGAKTGHGMAVAGLILGYLVTVSMTFFYGYLLLIAVIASS
jgi:hypothetical protein